MIEFAVFYGDFDGTLLIIPIFFDEILVHQFITPY